MNTVLPFDVIFPACREALDTALRPLPYKEILRRGLAILRIDPETVNFAKIAEDVREKMLMARWHGSVFYTGAPHYCGAVTYWFQNGFNMDEPIVIPANMRAAECGCFEALMRDMTKKNENASDESRMMAKARGMIIQATTTAWFMENWPNLYLPPENENLWDRPCDHDFRLKIGKRIIGVDVAGPDRNGDFGGAYKKPTDLHLLCDITGDGRSLEWLGLVPGTKFNDKIIPALAVSPLRMIVWLNCLQAGLDYEAIHQASYGPGLARAA